GGVHCPCSPSWYGTTIACGNAKRNCKARNTVHGVAAATREGGHARGTRAVTGARERQRIGYSRTDRNCPVVRQLQVAQAGGDLPASGTGHPAARCSIGSGVFRESQVHSTGPSGVEECILHYRKAGKLS